MKLLHKCLLHKDIVALNGDFWWSCTVSVLFANVDLLMSFSSLRLLLCCNYQFTLKMYYTIHFFVVFICGTHVCVYSDYF